MGYFDWHPKPDWWRDYTAPFDPTARVLDVGCGEGWLADHFPNYTGIDSAPDAVERATSRGRNVVLGSADNRLPFEDDSFDGVFMLNVLEHLSKPADLVDECRRVLRDRGRALACSPDAQRWCWDDYTHVRPFTRKSFCMLFEDQGMHVQRFAYEPLFFGTWALSRFRQRYKRPKLAWRMAWLPFIRRNVFVVAEKRAKTGSLA